jgi:hypothetical protein
MKIYNWKDCIQDRHKWKKKHSMTEEEEEGGGGGLRQISWL